MKLKKYLKIWLRTTFLSFQSYLTTRGASLMYILGKLLRFGFFLIMIVVVFDKKKIAGYGQQEIMAFFLIFNLLDLLGQLFFRGIYYFRHKVVTGQFDLILLKPVNSLFQILTAQTDFLDIPLLLIVIVMLIRLGLGITLVNFILFLLLVFCGFLIITAIHVLVASVGIMTTELDHIIWIYRDLSIMARLPIDIYLGPVKAFLTFIIPIALIFTFPAKALLGLLSWQGAVCSFAGSWLLLTTSLKFWRFALTKYSSASS